MFFNKKNFVKEDFVKEDFLKEEIIIGTLKENLVDKKIKKTNIKNNYFCKDLFNLALPLTIIFTIFFGICYIITLF